MTTAPWSDAGATPKFAVEFTSPTMEGVDIKDSIHATVRVLEHGNKALKYALQVFRDAPVQVFQLQNSITDLLVLLNASTSLFDQLGTIPNNVATTFQPLLGNLHAEEKNVSKILEALRSSQRRRIKVLLLRRDIERCHRSLDQTRKLLAIFYQTAILPTMIVSTAQLNLQMILKETLIGAPQPAGVHIQHEEAKGHNTLHGATEEETSESLLDATTLVASTECPSRRGNDLGCPCRCHALHSMHSPQSLYTVVGKLLLQYPLRCDHASCRNRDRTRLILDYTLPAWIFPFAWRLILSLQSQGGFGLVLRTSAVLPESHDVWNSVTTNNIPRLQHLFSTGQISPSVVDRHGRSLLHYCLDNPNCWPVANFLLSSTACSVSDPDYHGSTAFDTSLLALLLFELVESFPEEALSLYRRIVEMADEEDVRLSGIHYAILHLTVSHVHDAIRADLGAIDSLGWDGRTPLHWATIKQDPQKIVALLQHGANPDIQDRAGRTALHIAAYLGSESCVRELINWGTNINMADFSGNTALHFAVLKQSLTVCQLLADHTADMLSINDDSWYPFQMIAAACHMGDEKSIANIIQLLGFKSRECPSDRSETLIIHAVVRGHVPLFRALCHNGWDISVIDAQGHSILHAVGMFGKLNMINAVRDVMNQIVGFDPDLQDCHGWTATEYFEDRIKQQQDQLWGDQSQPTPEERKAFNHLIGDLRAKWKSPVYAEKHAVFPMSQLSPTFGGRNSPERYWEYRLASRVLSLELAPELATVEKPSNETPRDYMEILIDDDLSIVERGVSRFLLAITSHRSIPAVGRAMAEGASPFSQTRRVYKVTSCGTMIGLAVLFPIVASEGMRLPFCLSILNIFIIATLLFVLASYEAFIRFGPIVAPVAFLFLILASLQYRAKLLVPWLPLYISMISLIVVTVYELEQALAFQQLPVYSSVGQTRSQPGLIDSPPKSEYRPQYADTHQISPICSFPGSSNTSSSSGGRRTADPNLNSRSTRKPNSVKPAKFKNNGDMRRGFVRVFNWVHYQSLDQNEALGLMRKQKTDEISASASLTKDSGLFHYDETGSLFIGDNPLKVKQNDRGSRPRSHHGGVDEVETDNSSSKTLDGDGCENVFPPTLKTEFVDHLVAQYFKSHAGMPQTSIQGNGQGSSQGAGIAIPSQHTQSGGRGTGRRTIGNGDGDDAQDDESAPASQSTPDSNCDGRLLACPYYKWKPLTHKKSKLKKRADPRKSKSEHWFDIFKILFPDHPLPPNPWVEILLSAELVSLRNFISYNWREIFDARVEERIPNQLRSQTQAITEFSHQVFEDTVATLLERFEISRRSSATPTLDSSEASGRISRVWSTSADAEASTPTALTTRSGSRGVASPLPLSTQDDRTFQALDFGDFDVPGDFAMDLGQTDMPMGYDDPFGSPVRFEDLLDEDGMVLDDSGEHFYDCL